MENNDFYIAQCRELIEQKLAWGSSEQWQNQDFEALSEKILEQTKVSLSSSTLKRIWGKVRYESSPNLATLNALAQFIGYENWRAFASAQNNHQPQEAAVKEVVTQQANEITLEKSAPISAKKNYKKIAWVGVSFVLCCITLAFLSFQKKSNLLTYNNIAFSSKPVVLGLPNTVVFQYNIEDSNADSVFIQQSWDPKRRFRVAKDQKEYTSTYYYPGYFRAKLILNDSVVKEHDLFIETDGWLGTMDKGNIPIYFPKNEVEKDSFIGISQEQIILQSIDLQKDTFWTSLFYVKKDNLISSDNFSFEIELKNTFGKGDNICQHTSIVLLCTEGAHVIPLSIKGCVGELNLYLGNQEIEGKTHDLSAFGVNFSDWVRIKCQAKNKRIQIYVDEKLAYESDLKERIGEIVGTRIRFAGTGEVRNMNLISK